MITKGVEATPALLLLADECLHTKLQVNEDEVSTEYLNRRNGVITLRAP